MAQDTSSAAPTSQDHVVALLRYSLDQSPRATLVDHEIRRPLTPPLPVTPPTTLVEVCWDRLNGKTPRKATSDQQECLLLHKLPLELREKIYKEVLGDMTIHLFIFENKMRSVVCTRAPNPMEDDDYYGYVGSEEYKTEDEGDQEILNQFPRGIRGARTRNRCEFCKPTHLRSTYIPTIPRSSPTWGIGPNFLPLLLTCRKIYADAISMLYSHPTFSANHTYTLTDFLLTLPPPRRAALRSLRLVWPVPLNERHYHHYNSTRRDATATSSTSSSASASSDPAASLTAPPFGAAPPHDRVTWTAFWTLVATKAPRLRLVEVELVERGWWRRREWEAVIRPIAVVLGGGGNEERRRPPAEEAEKEDGGCGGGGGGGNAVRVEGLVRFQRWGGSKKAWREKRWRVGRGWEEAKWVDGWEAGEDERGGVVEVSEQWNPEWAHERIICR